MNLNIRILQVQYQLDLMQQNHFQIASESVGVGIECLALSVYLFVCLSVCPKHNSKTNDPKVFKLGGAERLKVKVRVSVNNNTAWVRTL